MPIHGEGPPKYDAETLKLMASTGARSVLVAIVDGRKGTGCAHKIRMTGDITDDCDQLTIMASVLRTIAAELDAKAASIKAQFIQKGPAS